MSDPVVFLDSKGRAYSLAVEDLPTGRGEGLPASSLVDIQKGAYIQHCIAGPVETKIFISSQEGYGFSSSIGDMVSSRKAGKDFMTLNYADRMLRPQLFEEAEDNYVAVISSDSRLLLFSIKELKVMTRGRGTILMGLHQGETIVATFVSNSRTITIKGVALKSKKERKIKLSNEKLGSYAGKRARMGRVLPHKVQSPIRIT